MAWILDQRSGKGYRVADHGWKGDEEFALDHPMGYSPRQIRHAYGIDALANDGEGQVIGIVDAFDYPTAAADLQHFSRTFGLEEMYGLPDTDPCTVAAGPHPCFQVIYGSGTKPAVNGFWALESALDTQWAHAIAPGADILLVETPTNFIPYLFDLGVDVAVGQGATVVSMSWGGTEGSLESVFDRHFNNANGVTFLAGAGDVGAEVFYPSASPYVLSVGGTTLHLDRKGRRTTPETAWSNTGGGISLYESEPGYQIGLPIPNTGGFRGTPDVAFNADPKTGQAVYDTTPDLGQTGWFILGGTSIAAPQWAGIVALINEGLETHLTSYDLISRLYAATERDDYQENYRDITLGSNGTCGAVCQAGPGYDFLTGLGTPKEDELVPFLTEKER